MSDRFYKDLPIHDDMRCIIDTNRFAELPDDWYVVIIDVVDSTSAIEKGLYREVNTVGVSAIAALNNAVRGVDIPYAFGGDGASMCVPPSSLPDVKKALSATVKMAMQEFGLKLRAGLMLVEDVKRNGSSLKVARCRMSNHLVNAMFLGDGLDYVENVIKQNVDNNFIDLSTTKDDEADFSGFECRWEEVPSRHGETISLLVKTTSEDVVESALVYGEILDHIETIYGDEKECHPLETSGLQLSFSKAKLRQELRIRTYGKGMFYKKTYWCRMLLENFLGAVLFGKHLVTSGVDWWHYKLNLVHNSDYKKFDGMLRMVISGDEKKRKQLTDILDEKERSNTIKYGMHIASAAQITCLVFDHKEDHIHFVDGANGGYAMASIELKKKLMLSNQR